MKFLPCIFAFIFCTCALAHDKADKPVYYKPGADVQLIHNYDGSSEADTNEQFSLQFTTGSLAAGKALTIHLNPSSELELLGDKKIVLRPVNNKAEMPVNLRAHKNGLHYLGVHAEVVDASGRRSFRVFELAIQVGDPKNNVKVTQHKLSQNAEGRKLVILESEERIRTNVK